MNSKISVKRNLFNILDKNDFFSNKIILPNKEEKLSENIFSTSCKKAVFHNGRQLSHTSKLVFMNSNKNKLNKKTDYTCKDDSLSESLSRFRTSRITTQENRTLKDKLFNMTTLYSILYFH